MGKICPNNNQNNGSIIELKYDDVLSKILVSRLRVESGLKLPG
ncbi:20305_t:CDS:2 [Racocetra persica]|uniref:20305_t:CDS:1 n=1 Tax=Racocetra persica TaxID=160502 RepID=A0ACA9KSY2_9GLOM|nr:20305_t:CDS:2 [Racocetra persica]